MASGMTPNFITVLPIFAALFKNCAAFLASAPGLINFGLLIFSAPRAIHCAVGVVPSWKPIRPPLALPGQPRAAKYFAVSPPNSEKENKGLDFVSDLTDKVVQWGGN